MQADNDEEKKKEEEAPSANFIPLSSGPSSNVPPSHTNMKTELKIWRIYSFIYLFLRFARALIPCQP